MEINYPFRSTDCNCANCGNCYNNLDKSCNNTPCLFLSGLREIAFSLTHSVYHLVYR